MDEVFISMDKDDLAREHICCALSDNKHQEGVSRKKSWLCSRFKEGHVFHRLAARSKVFIEYAPLEKAWVPIQGNGFYYIYCLWVSGSYKGRGYGRRLLEHAIEDVRKKGGRGLCVLSSKKKKPFLAEEKFFRYFGFKIVDRLGDYELLSLCFDDSFPTFLESARRMKIESKDLTVYYSAQCPFTLDCARLVSNFAKEHGMPCDIIAVDTLQEAKSIPSVFNNWAIFYGGRFLTTHLLNEKMLKKIIGL